MVWKVVFSQVGIHPRVVVVLEPQSDNMSNSGRWMIWPYSWWRISSTVAILIHSVIQFRMYCRHVGSGKLCLTGKISWWVISYGCDNCCNLPPTLWIPWWSRNGYELLRLLLWGYSWVGCKSFLLEVCCTNVTQKQKAETASCADRAHICWLAFGSWALDVIISNHCWDIAAIKTVEKCLLICQW